MAPRMVDDAPPPSPIGTPLPATETSASLRRRMGSAAALLTSAVLLSRIIGYLREAFVAGRFGASSATDAFYAAYTIPDFFNYLVAGGTLSVTFIPIYARYLARGEVDEGDRVFSIVCTSMSLLLALLLAVGWFVTPALAGWYLDDLPRAALPLAIRLSRILLLCVPLFYLGGVASATLLARQRFLAVATAPLFYNAGIIAGGIVLGGLFGVEGLVWGGVAGALTGPFLLQAIAARRAGLRYRPSLAVRHPAFREWIRLSLPLMVGVSVVTADEWIYRHFAAAVPGAVSRLSYARKLVAVPIAVAGQAVGQASMPFFARLFAEKRPADLAETLARTVRIVAVVCLLGGAFLAGLAEPLIDLLFRRGHFHPGDVGPTALYLALFAAAIPLWGVQGIYARAFYAAHDTLRPMVAGTLVTLVSIPLYGLLFRLLSVPGLCLASGIAIVLHTGSLVALLPRVLPEARSLRVRSSVGRGLVLAIGGGLAAHLAAHFARTLPAHGHLSDLFQLVAGGFVFATVVILAARPLHVDEVEILVRRFKRRGATPGPASA